MPKLVDDKDQEDMQKGMTNQNAKAGELKLKMSPDMEAFRDENLRTAHMRIEPLKKKGK